MFYYFLFSPIQKFIFTHSVFFRIYAQIHSVNVSGDYDAARRMI